MTTLEYLGNSRNADKEDRLRLLNRIKPRICEPYTKHIPHPAQQLFLLQQAEEVMYGGAAGGGKSDALLMSAMQYIDVPGYSALLLRRTWPDLSLPGAILDRAREWLADTDAHPREGGRIWTFPSGARLTFGYLHRENDKYRYQSAEFQFVGFDELTQFSQSMYEYLFSRIRRPNLVCLRCQKPVRKYHSTTGQSQWKHTNANADLDCDNLIPDPKVLRQYGPTKTGLTLFDVPLRMRSACVDQGEVLTTDGWKDISMVREGDTVYSMTRDGTLQARRVTRFHEYDNDKPMVRVRKKNLYMSMTFDHRVTYQKFGSLEYDTDHWDTHTGRSISIARAPERIEQPGWDDAPFGWDTDTYLAYLGLFLAEGCTNTVPHRGNYKTVITQCDPDNAKRVAELMDTLPYPYSHSANGDFQITNKDLWQHFSMFGKAHDKYVPRDILTTASEAQLSLLLKWLVFGDGHVRGDSIQYVTVSHQLADDVAEIGVRLGYKVMVSRKELPDPNHRDRYTVYLTRNQGNLTKVDKNDVRNDVELFSYDGKVYCIEVEGNHNFVIRQQGTVWISGNTNPGGIGHTWVREHFVDPVRKSPNAIFIPASLADNPSLDQETYRKNLEHLSPVDRERLMNGDWDVSEEGAYFQRHWFQFISEPPKPHRMKWLRYWDMAATKGGDYTAGCLMGLSDDGEWVVADMRRIQGTPREVERLIAATAMEDGFGVPIRMEQEPGSSGVIVIDHYRRRVLVGYDFRPDKKTGSKETLAKPVSSAAEAGNVSLVVGAWNRDFLDEVSLFPNGAHDDQIDSMSGAFHALTGKRVRILA